MIKPVCAAKLRCMSCRSHRLPIRSTNWAAISELPCPFGLVRPLTGIFLPGFETFCSRRNSPDFFQAVSGVERGQDDHAGQDVSAMGVWTSLEPQLTTPTTSPSLQGGGEPRVRGAV